LKYKIDTLEKKAAENEAILKQLEKFYQSLLDKERGKLGKTRYNEENEPQINNESNQKSSQKGALNVILNKVISKAVSYETQCPWVNDLKPHNADIEVK
jgi:ssDNA-binding Zn-finger/Zn-ribbon topoisomerase 1